MQTQQQPVRKAVIPAAGMGTRLFPATKAVKKELFPLIDRDGRAKPVILAIVEEALSAGIESVGIVVQPRDRPLFEAFFQTPPEGLYYDKLVAKHGDYLHYLQTLGDRITFIPQEKPEGFGHAVFCAKDWVQNEPFLLLLGDHVYTSKTSASCARQILEIFAEQGQSVIGIEPTSVSSIAHRGCITGNWQTSHHLLQVTGLYEKPTVEYASQHLRVADLPGDQLLAMFGLYVLPPQIFDYLEIEIRENRRDRDEFQLTTALEQLQQELGMLGYWVKGCSFDIGLPEAYRQALLHFGVENTPE